MLKKIIPPMRREAALNQRLSETNWMKRQAEVCVCVCVCALNNRSQLGNMIIISQYLNILIRLIKLGNVSSSIERWISC